MIPYYLQTNEILKHDCPDPFLGHIYVQLPGKQRQSPSTDQS